MLVDLKPIIVNTGKKRTLNAAYKAMKKELALKTTLTGTFGTSSVLAAVNGQAPIAGMSGMCAGINFTEAAKSAFLLQSMKSKMKPIVERAKSINAYKK